MTADTDVAPGVVWSTCPNCRGRGRVFAGTSVGYVRCQRCQPTTTRNPTRGMAPAIIDGRRR